MNGFGVCTLLLIVVTFFVSYKGFNDEAFTRRYRFDVGKVLFQKDYIRVLSSAFLHTTWTHLIFNMLALYAFGSTLESLEGSPLFLVIYLLSMAGSKAVALLIHKNHPDYTSVGASGAVNGIIYATIALFPTMGMGIFLLPLTVPAWAFGLAYVIFTIFGIKEGWGASGHASHLGGALTGMLVAIALHPEVLAANYLPILAILVPTVGFLLITVFRPELLIIHSAPKRKQHYSIDHQYNYQKAQEQADIDSILEKIHKRGMKSLSLKEKQALEQYSKMKR